MLGGRVEEKRVQLDAKLDLKKTPTTNQHFSLSNVQQRGETTETSKTSETHDKYTASKKRIHIEDKWNDHKEGKITKKRRTKKIDKPNDGLTDRKIEYFHAALSSEKINDAALKDMTEDNWRHQQFTNSQSWNSNERK